MGNSLSELADILFDQIRAINDTAIDDGERKRRVADGLAVAKLSDEVIKTRALQLRAIELKDRFETEYGKGDYGISLITGDVEGDV